MATLVGTQLDRYEIDAELGRGAMGVVYRARDPKLDRTVAIKTVSLAGLDAEAEQEYRKRFVVEAQAAGRLSHAGIVTIFDVREEEAEPYLVMEYVEGQSLQQLVSRENRSLPLSTTLRLVQEVAEALHYAHSQGVVHRDIKPANILVTSDGHPKIADFGIAKLNQAELTMPGQVLGSPAFMAPEQLGDEGVDARSDLFSLGVILYYMLTGHRPFQGNSTTTVCFKLVNHEPPSVSAFESKFPPELDKIVSRAIAKDPAGRYQSGMAMAADIRRLRESSGFVPVEVTGAAPVSLKADVSRRPVPDKRPPQTAKAKFSITALVFGLLAIVFIGLVFWSTHRTQRRNDPIATELTTDERTTGHVPDGTNKESAVQSILRDSEKSSEQAPVSKQIRVKASAAKPKATLSQGKLSQLKPTPPPVVKAMPATVSPDATLQIEIEHHFTDAVASIWVDDRLVYTQSLHGDKKRRALLFRKTVGHQFEVVRLAPGKHEVRVRVQSEAESYDQSRAVTGALTSGGSLLHIVCGTPGEGLQVSLEKQTYQ